MLLLGTTLVEFGQDLWHHNTRVPGLLFGLVFVILCLAILVELRLVTDTGPQHYHARALHLHGKKWSGTSTVGTGEYMK